MKAIERLGIGTMIQFDIVDLCLNWFLKQVKITISYSIVTPATDSYS